MSTIYGFDVGAPPESVHSILVEWDEPAWPPVKPVKGAWGVGKEYRKHRRHYAKALRKYKKRMPQNHRKVFIPHASFERMGDAFQATATSAQKTAEAFSNLGESIHSTRQEVKRELFKRLYDGGFVQNEVIEGTIVDSSIGPRPEVIVHHWGDGYFDEGHTYDEPVPVNGYFEKTFELKLTNMDPDTTRKLFGLL